MQLNCNIIEWGGGPLGPEAMFFKPNGGAEFEIWAVSRLDDASGGADGASGGADC